MRTLFTYKLVDLGYSGDFSKVEGFAGFTSVMAGYGSEAESALDDLLHTLQVSGYDVAGLEGDIKNHWNPEPERESSIYYTLVLLFTPHHENRPATDRRRPVITGPTVCPSEVSCPQE